MSSNKRVKHVAEGRQHGTRKKSLKRGSSSQHAHGHEDEHVEEDPHYCPEAQEARLVKFASRKQMYIRYADLDWLSGEGFAFPAWLRIQGVGVFVGLKGNIYPHLVKEFYANFLYRDQTFMSMIRGVRFLLDDTLFSDVAGLPSDGASITNCEDDRFDDFDAIEFYKSCLRNENLFAPGTLKRAGLFTVEDRLLHYVLVYLLTPRRSNHAQPNDIDLKYMYAIKKGIKVNWASVILSVMYDISSLKGTKPLAYGIFISRIIDHLGIDTTGQEVQAVSEPKHFFGENIIHQMQIYKRSGQWIHQQDQSTVDLDLDDEEDMAQDDGQQQVPDPQDAEIPRGQAENVPTFSIAHLDAMEQRLNERIDMRFRHMEEHVNSRIQGMEDRIGNTLRLQTEEIQANFDRLNLIMRTLGGFSQPPQPPQP